MPARAGRAAALALALAAATASAESGLRITDVGRYDFVGGGSERATYIAEELSGFARAVGDTYVVVSDEHACMHRLVIEVDLETGAIRRASFAEPLVLTNAQGDPLDDATDVGDREGIAFDPATRSVWIAHERHGRMRGAPSICQHSLDTGRMLRMVSAADDGRLAVFRRARGNRGFESLTRREDGAEFWTANEEALLVDGDTATPEHGSVVRLQRFDRDLAPVAQYAYVTDPVPSRIRAPAPLAGVALSGVSDLLVLPDGTLLVLERMFAGDAEGWAANRIRIYRADYSRADDVSRGKLSKGLAGKRYAAVEKTLMIELFFPLSNSNFEGIALGPRLANGDVSLLLIADNNAGTQQALYALRLSGAGTPAPPDR